MRYFKNADEFTNYLINKNKVISHSEIEELKGSPYILDFYICEEDGKEIFRISLENFSAFEMEVV